MPSSKSKHADLLRRLGFEPFDPQEVRRKVGSMEVRIEETDSPLAIGNPSPMATPMLAEGEPCFLSICTGEGVDSIGFTIAYDETGQAWRLFGKVVDLEPYGFTSALKPQVKH